jgi:Ni,Fe-hydrogenase maturation factor
MVRATQLERIVSKGQLLSFTFTQDKVADSQSAVAMNLVETKTARPKVTLVDGGSAGDHTVTGITTADTILFVGLFETKASIATLADLTDEFTITGADTINNAAGTATTNDQLFVLWHDADADADTLAITEAQIPWEFEVVGVSVTSTEARTAGTLTADVTIDGTVTGLQGILNGTDTTRDYATQPRSTDIGAAGSRVGVKLTTASWTPTTADIAVTVYVMAHIEGY